MKSGDGRVLGNLEFNALSHFVVEFELMCQQSHHINGEMIIGQKIK